MKNPYVPMPVVLKDVRFENESGDLKTFEFAFVNEQDSANFDFTPGQFAMVSINGVGEAPFGIASSPLKKDSIAFTIKKYKTGVVTTELHSMSVGTELGIRGPFGNGYPLKELEGKNLLVVGGGFALTTLRSTVRYILDGQNRDKYGKITFFAAAREPSEILYKDDIAQWQKRDDIEVIETIDQQADGWTGRVGFAAPVLEQIAPESKDTYAIVCGPPIMIKTCIYVLFKMGFAAEQIICSLEMRMKCGIGKCGRCNIGSKYICKDGPVFTYKQLQDLSVEF